MTYTLDGINAFDRTVFTAAFGGVFEHSPWVAERAWAQRPFDSVEGLHRAMVQAMEAAAPARFHPTPTSSLTCSFSASSKPLGG